MEFQERWAARSDRFQIFAFHNRSVQSLEELDGKMKRFVEQWGKELPFPILLDSTGQTYRNFSIRALGTSALIDPEGNVVPGDHLALLEKALEAMGREPPPAEEKE